MKPVKTGIIGVGTIFPQYIKWTRHFPTLDVVACADIIPEAAQARATEYGLKAMTVNELLQASEIELIINLTVPSAHAEVDLKIIESGKHVYAEKPLAINRDDGERILKAAQQYGVRVGSAPDTFLGGGIQTCRKIIEDGWIGTPIGASAFFTSHGPESWHPNPAFYYSIGGGPLFDMGPYYLTALVYLLGPIKRLAASTRKSFEERIATSEIRYGERISVNIATHNSATLEFTSGAVGTIMFSFDVWRSQVPRIEIYGASGTLSVPDPNTFGGPVRVWLSTEREWRDVPLLYDGDVGRGIGVADMAQGIRDNKPHRASGALAYHILDVMQAFDESSQRGQHIIIDSQPQQPDLLPTNSLKGFF